MDYTSVEAVKQALGSVAVDAATLAALGVYVTRASRMVDVYCTGVEATESADYFKYESVVGEVLTGVVDGQGVLLCHPHKPSLTSVTMLEYRWNPMQSWQPVDDFAVMVTRNEVRAWLGTMRRDPMMVRVSYAGGLAVDAASLPADLVEAATVMAARMYKEARTGLTDAMGVMELGSLVYSKAIPERVRLMLAPYRRVMGW